jgi:hypothetical protein
MLASAGSPAWLMFAHMFTLRAMNLGVERVFKTDRKPPKNCVAQMAAQNDPKRRRDPRCSAPLPPPTD